MTGGWSYELLHRSTGWHPWIADLALPLDRRRVAMLLMTRPADRSADGAVGHARPLDAVWSP